MPPGWYDDGHGALRWWDGSGWTEHVATPDPLPDPGAAPAAPVAHAASPTPAAEPGAADPGVTPAAAAEPLPPELAEHDPATGAPPYATPAGYPGGYLGGPAPAGAFVAATEAKKSKAWIVWVVIGVVLLGIVIAAAVLIPLLFLGLNSGGSGSGGTQPADGDQAAAVDAVELYDDAWQDADCDAYLASTTEDFRIGQSLPDCETFVPEAEAFDDSFEDYEVEVTGISQDGDTITVSTSETFLSLFDEEGAPVTEPVPGEAIYEYTVINVDGAWLIDALTFE